MTSANEISLPHLYGGRMDKGKLDLEITFPGEKRVYATIDGHCIRTDEPCGGKLYQNLPCPFHLLLTSIGTCLGSSILQFCDSQGIETSDIKILQRSDVSSDLNINSISISILVPQNFPLRHEKSIVKAGRKCSVISALDGLINIMIDVERTDIAV